MSGRGRGELALGVMAAAFWSPGIFVTVRAARAALESGADPQLWPMAFAFYVLFWAALLCGALLVVTGQVANLSVLKRREYHALFLAALGGYGFWILTAIGMGRVLGAVEAPTVGHMVRLLSAFYAAPVLMGVLSVPSREGARLREMIVLVLGCVGAVLIVRSMAPEGVEIPTAGVTLPAIGAAACWALFGVAARPLVRESRALPLLTVVLAAGAACMLVTCLPISAGMLSIGGPALGASALVGCVCVGFGMLCWLGALSSSSPARVAPFWYLAMVFGIVWARLIGDVNPGWQALGGALLVFGALYVHVAGGGRRGADDML